jgi:hypothetical protein
LATSLLTASGCASWRGDIHAKELAYQRACQVADRHSEEQAMVDCYQSSRRR